MKKGFTLIEIVIVLAILAIFGSIMLVSFWSLNKSEGLSGSSQIVRLTLSQARSKTMSGEGGAQYGVYFGDSSSVTLFKGNTYDANSPDNVVYPLHSSAEITNISLAGGATSIVFKKLTGDTDQNGAVTISRKDGAGTHLIRIYRTGAVH